MKKPIWIRLIGCLLSTLLAADCAARRTLSPVPELDNAEAFVAKADAFTAGAQYDGANFFLARAADIYRAEKCWAKVVQCLMQMGNNAQKVGDLEAAETMFAEALQITLDQNEGQDLELSRSMMQLAFKRITRKQYRPALELLNRCLAIQQRILGSEHPELGKIYNSLALLHLHMGDTQKANEFTNKSLSAKIRKFLEADSAFFKNYNFLDGVNISKRSFADMSGMLDKSLVVYLESLGSSHPLVASIYEKMGMVCALQGEHERGLEFFRKALRIWLDKAGDDDIRVAAVYEEIGICLRLQGEWESARSFLLRALAIARDVRQSAVLASIHYQLGKVDFLQKRHADALRNYGLALDAQAAGVPDVPLAGEPVTEKQNRLEILASQAEAFAARAGTRAGEKKDLLDAFQAVQGATQLIEALRMDYKSENYRLLFGEKCQRVLDLAVSVALELFRTTGNPDYRERAFVFSEKSKAALLSENMHESNARQFAGIPPDKLGQERELMNELAQCETMMEMPVALSAAPGAPTEGPRQRYFTLLSSYQEMIAGFERDYPGYFELKYRGKNVSSSSLQNNLPEDMVLIEYFLGSTQLTIFFLSRNKFEVVSHPLEPGFDEAIAAYCLAIKKIDEQAFLQLSPRLYRALIHPIEGWLKGKKQLLIIPDRALAYLPFETLVGEECQVSDFSRLEFLIRRFAISYHFSAHLWQSQMQRTPSPHPDFWGGFAPVFSGNGRSGYVIHSSDLKTGAQAPERVTRTLTLGSLEFPELPGTENEVQSILALFASRNLRSIGYFHSLASEALFKSPAMKDFSMIHLATHSLTDAANPKLSGFLFSPPAGGQEGKEDGILYAGETYNLNLDCKLLVLSSCESGTGRLVAGEGLLALTRGLFYSGARNIVFSLWKVEDRTTGDLMVRLYQEILQGGSFAQAMKKAKMTFIANPFTAFPKYWAGFILLGI